MLGRMKTDKVRDIASLHEQTVVDAARHAGAYTRRARAAASRPRTGALTNLIVDRAVWREAMKLAGGDGKRITIVSATEVRVR